MQSDLKVDLAPPGIFGRASTPLASHSPGGQLNILKELWGYPSSISLSGKLRLEIPFARYGYLKPSPQAGCPPGRFGLLPGLIVGETPHRPREDFDPTKSLAPWTLQRVALLLRGGSGGGTGPKYRVYWRLGD